MRAVILAAGYGTRMRGLLGDRPKALVELAQRTLLDRLLDVLEALRRSPETPVVGPVVVVSNSRHLRQFEAALAQRRSDPSPLLLDDGSMSVADRRGALGDLAFVGERCGIGAQLVLAADTLLRCDIAGLTLAPRAVDGACVALWRNDDEADRRRRGNARLEADGRVSCFIEKPEAPASPWSAAPLYVLSAAASAALPGYLAAGGNGDAPGHFMAWLADRGVLTGWRMPAPPLDVGNPESYRAALLALRRAVPPV